jgi:hypothetical protein
VFLQRSSKPAHCAHTYFTEIEEAFAVAPLIDRVSGCVPVPIPSGTVTSSNWSTSANGFVFSNDEISRRLDFDKRVTAAIVLSRNGWQLPRPHGSADAGMPKAA